jgi:hypothetical protein
MNRLLFVLVLIVVCGVGLGFYLGWFHVGSENAGGKSNVTLSVDGDKFQKDRNGAVASMKDAARRVEDEVAGSSDKRMVGKLVSVGGDSLKMTDEEGKEQIHPLAADVKVTCDGKTCAASDLKAGMKIRVTTGAAEQHPATRIEALDGNRDFEKGS